MRNHETGLDYAKFDHQETRIRQGQYRHKPDWRDEYLELIKRSDYESAHELRMLNDEDYREREQVQREPLPLEHPKLQSLQHAGIERVETEAA